VLHRTREAISGWDVSPGGVLLRRISRFSADHRKILSACVDAVPIPVSGEVPVGLTGVCGVGIQNVTDGAVSPDAIWAVLAENWPGDHSRIGVVSVADLHAGRWPPKWLLLGRKLIEGTVDFWDTSRSFILQPDLIRCDVAGQCRALKLPKIKLGEWEYASLIQRRGM
jgi:hypothetical protein